MAFSLALLLASRTGEACAVCGAADKTLPASGNEIAYAGRVRATIDGRAAGFAARAVPLRVAEVRLVPGAAISLGADVLLSADVPILRRALVTTDEGGGNVDHVILGDAEARLSYIAYRARAGIDRRLTFHGGAKAPTAPLERDANGRPVPTDLQPGCGSIVPSVGATYTLAGSLVSGWANASFLMPIEVRGGPHPGDSLRASVTGQIQPTMRFAARASVLGRLDMSGDIDGQVDSQSGGATVYVAPELVVSPATDLVVTAGASFPAISAMRGHVPTSPVALVGIGYDF